MPIPKLSSNQGNGITRTGADVLGYSYRLGIGSTSLRVGTDKIQCSYQRRAREGILDNQLYRRIRALIAYPLRVSLTHGHYC